MNSVRKQRLTIIIFLMIGISIAIGLALYALRQNINLYYTPTQVSQGKVPVGRTFRLGGLVEKNSVHFSDKKLDVSFVLTDTAKKVTVDYHGILPDLFREGQGIVTQGRLDASGKFIADQVLAKHDATYMPNEVRDAIKVAKQYKQQQRLNAQPKS